MALKYNYNKTTIQQFKRQLSIRERALPILKNKETALRQEVKTLSNKIEKLEIKRGEILKKLEPFRSLWNEFPDIFKLTGIQKLEKKIIGVKVPEIQNIEYEITPVGWWRLDPWVPGAISALQEIVELDLEIQVKKTQLDLLHTARKKTTQKVNLYEKVQIPEYSEAILKIKRFLEDKENIAKAGQKIMKKIQEKRVAA